jgi:hypothetical protein
MLRSLVLIAAVLVSLAFVAALSAADDIRKEPVEFSQGSTGTTVKGNIKGHETVDYIVAAKAGQTIAVNLKTSNRMAYFNVLPPSSETALFVGSSDTTGEHFSGQLPADGDYTLRVYLMRAAARRNESAQYTLDISVTGPASASVAPAAKGASLPSGLFQEDFELQGVSFRVSSPNVPSGNTLEIVPAGLEIDNTPINRAIDGIVTGAEVADINADGSAEVYVYVTESGTAARGLLIAFSANKKKSLSEIYLPELTDDAKASQGYRGHDEMAVVEGVLARRFPIYDGADPPAPTGRMRQLQYKLKPGEAGWVLLLDRVTEF